MYFPGSTLIATRCKFANSECGAYVEGNITSATFKNCIFNDNKYDGVYGSDSTIHLHGDATVIHSNGRYGITAVGSSKVIIRLPSHHKTIYNNGKEDRYTSSGSTITNVEE